MNYKEFTDSSAGKCIKTQKDYWAFMPASMTELVSQVQYDENTIHLLSKADRLLGELAGTGRVLKNPYLLIYPYIRREAVSSSKIEGTQSSLSDLFFYEAMESKEPKIPDVREVNNYVKSTEEGIRLLDSLPISARLICELHKILMGGVRGEHGTPGEMRRSQNWIGPPGCTLNESTFVPPPVEEMKASLSDWEKYVNSDSKAPVLVQAAIMHYQFESIHPFIDGNGRIGRLLIILFLMQKECIKLPLLYMSEFFEKYRDEYYARLLGVSQRGDVKEWVVFFLNAVISQAEDALTTAAQILECYDKYQLMLKKSRKLPESAYKIIDEIFLMPVITITRLQNKLIIPYNSVKNGVARLVKMGVLKEVGTRKRNKLYMASELLELLTSRQGIP